MTHTLIALIVKAASESEAERKAEYVIDNVICDYDLNEFGVVLNSKHDLESTSPDTYRWIPRDKTHPAYEELSNMFKTAAVNSDWAQKFIKLSYGPGSEEESLIPKNDLISIMAALASSVHFVRDETGSYIPDRNDSRLTSNEYFVVPVDICS